MHSLLLIHIKYMSFNMNSINCIVCVLSVLINISTTLQAQIGISVSPPKVYYVLDKGQSKTEEVLITNVSQTKDMDLSVSLGDWKYSPYGENEMYPADSLDISCAGWVNINGLSYLSLKPGESKALNVTLTAPDTLSDNIPVHTALLYITQMNPTESTNQNGANMRISVRSGIKLYHQTTRPREQKIDVKNLTYDKNTNKAQLIFENTGNGWLEGNIMIDLLHIFSGKEISLNSIRYYTLPNDVRIIDIPLPHDISKGEYTMTTLIDIGDENVLEAAELRFSIE